MKHLNYKLVNTLLMVILVFLIWLMKDLWLGILTKIINVLLPFVIAFAIAYVLHPMYKKIKDKGVPAPAALIIICLVLCTFIVLFYGY